MITFEELDASHYGLRKLETFYQGAYVSQFPDPDERESLANMAEYLRLKHEGWYGENNYHIILAWIEDRIAGGVVVDYLALPKVGVIEFLFVESAFRGQGAGTRLLEFTEGVLSQDALQQSQQPLNCIVAEMNNPNIPNGEDNIDPALRANIWGKWGYCGLDFPYVQPALSSHQKPVYQLILITKILNPAWHQQIPAQTLKHIVHEYLSWAMRIDTPAHCKEFQEMARHLDQSENIACFPLS